MESALVPVHDPATTKPDEPLRLKWVPGYVAKVNASSATTGRTERTIRSLEEFFSAAADLGLRLDEPR